ncbi:hypothetical protein [Thalassobellus suaedae]|uniref:Secretion system C-terminal sorting domain-containing protein n=1 Tax=Thalassobellus suaedae TaxID=3074124 RepID=A0ABY9Y143_9FLAO|nr:hypothetical protein RHP49_13600 [Flavobacteriaceae bacterium HL-DH10]
MKHCIITIKFIALLIFGFISFKNQAQNDKVIFVKDVPVKLKSASSYSFFVGYEVSKDSDLALDISGGPGKFWAGKTIPVDKGKGVFQFQISPKDKPRVGKGYRILVSVRDRGGDWKTERASSIIRNVEITKTNAPILDDASFSLLTPTSLSSREVFEFDINYKASGPRLLQVALWNGQQWIAASQNSSINTGEGSIKVTLNAGQQKEGNKYRFVLYYGSGEGFPNENIVSKELSGIEITKAIKVLTLDDLNEQHITLSLNKNSNILTLPGNPSYEFIRIISANGEIVKEETNTNSITISDLNKGAYYAITSKDDYYKFVKL